MPSRCSRQRERPAEERRRKGHRPYGGARWLALLLGAVLSALLLPRIGAAEGPMRLFVFVTTDIRPHALEQEIASSLPGIQVRVFGRVKELQTAVRLQTPDAILARPAVLETLGRAATLRGSRHGSTAEDYVLLSIGRPMKPSELGAHALGTVDLVGRNEMKAFVSRVLGTSAPRLKLVTTEHDLLPLLQFGEAAAVLTAEPWAAVLQKKSNLDLKRTVLANKVELPALHCASDVARAAVEPKVRAWTAALNARLGVDEWK